MNELIRKNRVLLKAVRRYEAYSLPKPATFELTPPRKIIKVLYGYFPKTHRIWSLLLTAITPQPLSPSSSFTRKTQLSPDLPSFSIPPMDEIKAESSLPVDSNSKSPIFLARSIIWKTVESNEQGTSTEMFARLPRKSISSCTVPAAVEEPAAEPLGPESQPINGSIAAIKRLPARTAILDDCNNAARVTGVDVEPSRRLIILLNPYQNLIFTVPPADSRIV